MHSLSPQIATLTSCSQVHQAICYDYTISLLRRKMRDPKRVSMGTLYWQLNDVWQVRRRCCCLHQGLFELASCM